MILLQHAQAQADPQSRKAVARRGRGDLSRGQPDGRRPGGIPTQPRTGLLLAGEARREGRKLFDEVLRSRNRDPALLLRVADLLRNIGSHSEWRTLAEEGYNKASDSRIKESSL